MRGLEVCGKKNPPVNESTRAQIEAFFAGGGVALAVSGGLVAARLTLGGAEMAVAANLVASVAAVLAFRLAARAERRSPGDTVLVPAVAGVLGATLLVHACVIAGPYRTHAWLAEGPRQLVNDFAASFSILLAAWACAKRSTVLALVVVGGLLGAYRMTMPLWHLDTALFHAITVQQLVLAESIAALFAIVIFRAATSFDPE